MENNKEKWEISNNCKVCKEYFASKWNVLWRDKHHCRACGGAVCGKCSSHSVPLKKDDVISVRVCDPCYNKYIDDADDFIPEVVILSGNWPKVKEEIKNEHVTVIKEEKK